jgi:APA family basic amino acid/polyamine antiporter
MSHLFLKKDISQLIADAEDPEVEGGYSDNGLKRTLGPISITMLGIGAIIGAGIFTLTGKAAANYAGPGIIYSFIISGALCTMAGLCYAEMAAMIPVSGSAYAYAYATMGEGIAWIMGLLLVLNYAFGAGAVVNGWSSYLLSLIRTTGFTLPDTLLYYTKGPWELITLGNGQQVHGFWNIPASFIVIVITAILYRGITTSANLNSIIVITNVTIIILFIALGIGVVSSTNIHANPTVTGLASLIPAREVMIDATGHQVARYGWLRGGVLTGAGVVFFAFIGFDSVSTVAQEARCPKRDIPIGIMASLLICTVLYVLVAFTLTGIVPYKNLDVSDPIALGIDRIVILRNWNATAKAILTFTVKLGALAGLSSVVLVNILSQTRIFYAMAKDKLLPWFETLHPQYRTPHIATVFTGIFVTICGGLLPINLVANLVSLGTLLVFLLVCISVPLMNYINPDAERSFRVPYPWLVGIIGAISCFRIMISMDLEIWTYLIFWLTFGFGLYCIYGRRHSIQQKNRGFSFGPIWVDYAGLTLQIIGITTFATLFTRNKTNIKSLSILLSSHINIGVVVASSIAMIFCGLYISLTNTEKRESKIII